MLDLYEGSPPLVFKDIEANREESSKQILEEEAFDSRQEKNVWSVKRVPNTFVEKQFCISSSAVSKKDSMGCPLLAMPALAITTSSPSIPFSLSMNIARLCDSRLVTSRGMITKFDECLC